ncbi:hypothetical protein OGAPHI_007270 [Ogataea philodendri]|uniref:Uncharacterized protein n=1 Tax=Ogataea philodendri TaxID=1378263 RepID=A0A9P8SZP1_9ASCO|nr:uncharacterized protein OGAPHI_007270 [Ogataea philodendri]KAH3660065.1 hypothetical protein OGAPHI_007270 [Ogataea philodendri]
MSRGTTTAEVFDVSNNFLLFLDQGGRSNGLGDVTQTPESHHGDKGGSHGDFWVHLGVVQSQLVVELSLSHESDLSNSFSDLLVVPARVSKLLQIFGVSGPAIFVTVGKIKSSKSAAPARLTVNNPVLQPRLIVEVERLQEESTTDGGNLLVRRKGTQRPGWIQSTLSLENVHLFTFLVEHVHKNLSSVVISSDVEGSVWSGQRKEVGVRNMDVQHLSQISMRDEVSSQRSERTLNLLPGRYETNFANGNVLTSSENIPSVFSTMAELAACNRCRQRVFRQTDLLVNVLVGKVIFTTCHGTNENADTLVGLELCDIVLHSNDWSVIGQSDLAALGW